MGKGKLKSLLMFLIFVLGTAILISGSDAYAWGRWGRGNGPLRERWNNGRGIIGRIKARRGGGGGSGGGGESSSAGGGGEMSQQEGQPRAGLEVISSTPKGKKANGSAVSDNNQSKNGKPTVLGAMLNATHKAIIDTAKEPIATAKAQPTVQELKRIISETHANVYKPSEEKQVMEALRAKSTVEAKKKH
jgi:hypothetical protein